MLKRVLEPEVMDTADDAREYDAMDHAAVNRVFVNDFLQVWTDALRGDRQVHIFPLRKDWRERAYSVLDLGAGTAQIPIELARRAQHAHITAVDAAESMLVVARQNIAAANLTNRIEVTL